MSSSLLLAVFFVAGQARKESLLLQIKRFHPLFIVNYNASVCQFRDGLLHFGMIRYTPILLSFIGNPAIKNG